MGSRDWITQPDDYVCTLSEETQMIAKDELREDEYTRQSALASMREWIMQNPKICNVRMGISYFFTFSFLFTRMRVSNNFSL